MVTLDFIETLKQVLETRGVRQADMSYVVASLWTQDQVPEIQNDDQYQEYLTLWHRLNAAAGLPRAENFTRSREGIYLDSRITANDESSSPFLAVRRRYLLRPGASPVPFQISRFGSSLHTSEAAVQRDPLIP